MLELDHISRRFGETVALDGLSLQVEPGALTGFVGANGAGKTTAMRVALGVLEPDGGAVRWQGRPVTAADRARFGYMPEERGLYPRMRVGDQVEHFARLHGLDGATARQATAETLELVGLGDQLATRTDALSLGNQQRVQLAVALVHDPELLVLDEPFSGLDPIGVDVMAEVLRARADRGVPVVFSSHQLDLVERLCDAVAIVRDGRVVAQGPVAELRRRGGRRYRVEVEGDDGDAAWAAGVPGARALGGGLLALDDDADDQALLDAARAAGPVRAFAPAEPRLADVFREAVAP
ncbi:ABC transporter ATP-binding protein [Baekduia sp. Peel2402]|uniref:ABC transporter ATP-binding protein n=1 Tax=Baekduia sp. Peel2402 TaxID=3458296 RepID=UPI00403EE636